MLQLHLLPRAPPRQVPVLQLHHVLLVVLPHLPQPPAQQKQAMWPPCRAGAPVLPTALIVPVTLELTEKQRQEVGKNH